jgi:hypothetical protein
LKRLGLRRWIQEEEEKEEKLYRRKYIIKTDEKYNDHAFINTFE